MNYSSFINYNQSFHYEIWRAAGNEKMEHMLAELWNGLSLGVQSTVEKYAKNVPMKNTEQSTKQWRREMQKLPERK